MSLYNYKAFAIILCLANGWQLCLPYFWFLYSQLCSSFSSEWVCRKIKVNFNQNHRTELWNFTRISSIKSVSQFVLKLYSWTPCGESPSITSREWQREIDQIISRQSLLWYTQEISLRCNNLNYFPFMLIFVSGCYQEFNCNPKMSVAMFKL